MRLGGPVFSEFQDPQQWIASLRQEGYRAAYCPVSADADETTVRAYAQAAEQADIVIAEVGAWSNPISPDPEIRSRAISHCQKQLALADRIGARCCVNIAGSRGEKWDGHHPHNLTEDTFDLILTTVRQIIDAVNPTRTCYTLETMPRMYPDSADSYLRLVEAIARKQFAVHFDPVNLVSSPQRYYRNGELIRDFVDKLGPHIKSCHAKDIALSEKLTVHLDEVPPGLGNLDYGVLLRELNGLHPDTPLMMEHLSTAEEFRQAAIFIRGIAAEIGVELR